MCKEMSARLKLATIIIEDDAGNQYPVSVESGVHCTVKTEGDPASMAYLMAGIIVGGGWDAIEKFFKKSDSSEK